MTFVADVSDSHLHKGYDDKAQRQLSFSQKISETHSS